MLAAPSLLYKHLHLPHTVSPNQFSSSNSKHGDPKLSYQAVPTFPFTTESGCAGDSTQAAIPVLFLIPVGILRLISFCFCTTVRASSFPSGELEKKQINCHGGLPTSFPMSAVTKLSPGDLPRKKQDSSQATHLRRPGATLGCQS